MKRDLELIRKILEEVESNDRTYVVDWEIEGHDFNEIAFHIDLLNDAQFVKAIIEYGGEGEYSSVFVERLTWEGFEFLELARNNTIWEKAKKILKENAISVSVSIFSDLMKSIAHGILKL